MSEKGGRWIYDKDLNEVIPSDEFYARQAEKHGRAPTVVPDIKAFVSPIDGKEVGGRASLREHNRRHNVVQIGNDLKSSEYNVAPKRNEAFNERAFENAYRNTVQKVQF